jgi:3-deoxy-manno-octulosonate cytidylyltransferase (CMP-KDO synthetase)
MTHRKTIAVIPARYASTRFPGKVLADLCGKPMIQHVWEKAAAAKVDEVLIAADDEKVIQAVKDFGGNAVMTSPDHPSGTDRIYEAIAATDAEIIINVQGDEPLIPVAVINQLIDKMQSDPSLEMGTVAVPRPRAEIENDPNKVKAVFGDNGMALYFSRSMVPHLREGGNDTTVYLHWGIYAYRRDILQRFISLPEGRLEQCEKLEQLRALENGISIFVLTSNLESIGVDTPEDLEHAAAKLQQLQ